MDIQAVLDRGGEIKLQPGRYVVEKTLRLRSDTRLDARGAELVMADGPRKRGDFLMQCSDAENVTVTGGSWSGNCAGVKKGGLFDPEAYSGAVLDFFGVKGLTLKGLLVRIRANTPALQRRIFA